MALYIACPKCEEVYGFEPEQIGLDCTCEQCGAKFALPVDTLETQIDEITGSFHRIFIISLILAMLVSLFIAGILSQTEEDARSGLVVAVVAFLLLSIVYTGYFMSIGFGFKAIAQESGCLFFLSDAFGATGSIIAAFFLGPILAPFQALSMWTERRRCRRRLLELSGGARVSAVAPAFRPAPAPVSPPVVPPPLEAPGQEGTTPSPFAAGSPHVAPPPSQQSPQTAPRPASEALPVARVVPVEQQPQASPPAEPEPASAQIDSLQQTPPPERADQTDQSEAKHYAVTCTCGYRMHVREEHFGRTGKCRKCGQPIHVSRDVAEPLDSGPRGARLE